MNSTLALVLFPAPWNSIVPYAFVVVFLMYSGLQSVAEPSFSGFSSDSWSTLNQPQWHLKTVSNIKKTSKYATNISIVDSKLVQLTIIFVATVHASRQLLAQSLL